MVDTRRSTGPRSSRRLRGMRPDARQSSRPNSSAAPKKRSLHEARRHTKGGVTIKKTQRSARTSSGLSRMAKKQRGRPEPQAVAADEAGSPEGPEESESQVISESPSLDDSQTVNEIQTLDAAPEIDERQACDATVPTSGNSAIGEDPVDDTANAASAGGMCVRPCQASDSAESPTFGSADVEVISAEDFYKEGREYLREEPFGIARGIPADDEDWDIEEGIGRRDCIHHGIEYLLVFPKNRAPLKEIVESLTGTEDESKWPDLCRSDDADCGTLLRQRIAKIERVPGTHNKPKYDVTWRHVWTPVVQIRGGEEGWVKDEYEYRLSLCN